MTDEDAPGPIPDVARPTEREIAFLLDSLNRVLSTPIRRDQVRGAYAGLRPLVDSGDDSTSDISRRHLVTESEAGFVNVLGGKLTTYRRMAQDAVDLAVRVRGLSAGPSRTASLRLVDAVVPPSDPLFDDLPLTRAGIEFAVRSEGALTADDVLDRRTRVGLVDADRARALPMATELMTAVLSEFD